MSDFDGDAAQTQDLVIVNEASNSFSFLAGNGDGTFQDSVNTTGIGIAPYSVAAADFNGDGFLDLAISNSMDNNVIVFPGRGDGTFGDAFAFDVGPGPHILIAGDFNNDGQMDLVVANSGADYLSVLFNNSR